MKLGLGTVQLGIPYGIANRTGKPEVAEAESILTKAAESGIDCFDTASTYGDCEERIGGFLEKNSLQSAIKISTKVKSIHDTDKVKLNQKELKNRVLSEIQNALKSLKVNHLDYYLLHNANDLYCYGQNIVNVLQELSEEGFIGKFGVSVYSPKDVEEFLSYDGMSVIQIPFNVLDNRLVHGGHLTALHNKNVEVHARSVYLQGLLLMEADQVPADLQAAIPFLRDLDNECGKLGLARKQLALCYVRDTLRIDRFFVGCETTRQITEVLALNSLPPLPEDMVEKLSTLFRDVPESVVNPSLWNKS